MSLEPLAPSVPLSASLAGMSSRVDRDIWARAFLTAGQQHCLRCHLPQEERLRAAARKLGEVRIVVVAQKHVGFGLVEGSNLVVGRLLRVVRNAVVVLLYLSQAST